MVKKQKVLIVEDEYVNRCVLEKIVKTKYDVISAENGQEALTIIDKQSDVSAVILDLLMPVMNGYQFLEEIRNRDYTSLPILIATGDDDSKKEAEMLEKGAWDFVTKPYVPNIILARLKNIIDRSEMALYKEMERASAHDPLTGLHNRNRMFRKSQEMISNNPDKKFIFMKMDIDRFGLYNASFGEDEGDKLLIFLADIIKKLTNNYAFCEYGRISGDVFAICREYTDGIEEQLTKAAEYVKEELVKYRDNYLIEPSAGVYIIDDNTLSIEQIYQRANMAASKCKRLYGHYIGFFDYSMIVNNSEEIWINNEMQTAIDEKQFEVYIQPKVNLNTDHCCGGEALVRWNHPTRGLISPGVFIPVFEGNGFISTLDYYVWEHTCKIIADWSKKYRRPYPLSVNISRVSLYNPNLVSLIVDLVDKYELDHSLLQLEITESAYMSNEKLMAETIYQFKEAGFTILMDDFGSGFSSLNTLKSIDIDILKIDMRFLSSEGVSTKGEIILSSVIKMANWLGMGTIVEGVETMVQRDFVEGTGCNHVQGYFYSKPIKLDEFEEKYYHIDGQDNYTQETVFNLNKKEILVIDDEQITHDILKGFFEDEYIVSCCYSVEEALLYLKKHRDNIGCILVDNVMEKMTGMDFLTYCRDIAELMIIPKVMITAFDNVDDKIKAFELGAYDYITKPFIKDIVVARINHVMQLTSYLKNYYENMRAFEQINTIDDLTGLLDKRSFMAHAEDHLKHYQDNVSMMVVDIDNFKMINDKYGHLTGDKILKTIGKVLKNHLRSNDLIGRFGGDEFVILMTNVSTNDAARDKANSLINDIGIISARDLHINVSVSIGISFNDGIQDVDMMFDRADTALYEAKKNGKSISNVFGESIENVDDNDNDIIVLCGENANVYVEMAHIFEGDHLSVVNVLSFQELKDVSEKYRERIVLYLLDTQYSSKDNSQEFYDYVYDKVITKGIGIVAIYQESNIDCIRIALQTDIKDVISWPLDKDTIRRRIFRAINLNTK